MSVIYLYSSVMSSLTCSISVFKAIKANTWCTCSITVIVRQLIINYITTSSWSDTKNYGLMMAMHYLHIFCGDDHQWSVGISYQQVNTLRLYIHHVNPLLSGLHHAGRKHCLCRFKVVYYKITIFRPFT